jgi:hypothetical protein
MCARPMTGLRALVLYESLFGNTGAVAEAVAAGIRAARPDAVVDCRRVDECLAPDEFELLVLGAPTHFWGLTGGLSRTMESQYERRWMSARVAETVGATRQAAATTGMRGLLGTLPPGGGRPAAAFDTCMTGPLTGGARGAIARRLERAGYRLVAEPETFLVEAVAGPLRTGELERARAWGEALAHALGEQHTPNWRKTMERDTDVLTTPDGATVDHAPLTVPRTTNRATIQERGPLDVTRIVTTTEVVIGAVLVARYLSRRPGSSKALVTMGPGGWVSMKGGTVAVRRGSRPWARPIPVAPTAKGERAPLWARVLSAVPLQALMR